MYIQDKAVGIGRDPSSLAGLGLDVERAVRLNTRYARRLGWDRHVGQIASVLGLEPGRFDPSTFARALERWQTRRGVLADGILGPQTWAELQRQLAPVPPPPPPSTPGAGGFVPTPVESPGGGRIRDKSAPDRSLLVRVPGLGRRRIPLHPLAAAAWQALVSAARRDGIRSPLLRPVSGFRDPARQRRLWERALEKYGSRAEARKWVAPPGSSAHQSGRAIDFYLGGRNSSGNAARLRTSSAYRWLVNHAERFGFYPYAREPWHWEYNPPARPTGGRIQGFVSAAGIRGSLTR